MNWSDIQNSWKDYQVNAKQQWDKLTDELLAATHGKREDLSSRVQEAYGLSKADSEKQISDWQARQQPKEQQPQQPAKQ